MDIAAVLITFNEEKRIESALKSLDGFPGLVIAFMNGYSAFLRQAKLREIWTKGECIEPFPY